MRGFILGLSLGMVIAGGLAWAQFPTDPSQMMDRMQQRQERLDQQQERFQQQQHRQAEQQFRNSQGRNPC